MTPLEYKEKMDIVMQEIEELNKTQKRNYEFTETIEKLSYDRIDEMRQMMKLAIQELASTKQEMVKNVAEFQVSLNKATANIPAKEKDSRLGAYKELSEQITRALPRTEF